MGTPRTGAGKLQRTVDRVVRNFKRPFSRAERGRFSSEHHDSDDPQIWVYRAESSSRPKGISRRLAAYRAGDEVERISRAVRHISPDTKDKRDALRARYAFGVRCPLRGRVGLRPINSNLKFQHYSFAQFFARSLTVYPSALDNVPKSWYNELNINSI